MARRALARFFLRQRVFKRVYGCQMTDQHIQPDRARGLRADLQSTVEEWSLMHFRGMIDHRLEKLMLKAGSNPVNLHRAMTYSLLTPGKRLRPLLTVLTSLHFGRRDLAALDVACAIEMVHAASLSMDDLPSMDNATVRRGQPTLHLAFGDDTAILASVALLNQAFETIVACKDLPSELRLDLMRLLTSAIGINGLIGGQAMDLNLRSGTTRDEELIKVNKLKTAALFAAAAEAGARIAGVKGKRLDLVRQFALELGAAFQIADDLLDDHAYAGKTGKDTGKDANKPTLLSRNGIDDTRHKLRSHLTAALTCLDQTGSHDQRLRSLIDDGFSNFLS